MRHVFRLILGLCMAVPTFSMGSGAADDTRITFATDWRAQAEHGGFYQALAAGYFKDEGLDVRIRPGGPQVDIPRLMAAGALDIAMASNSFQPFTLRGAGADVTIVMTVFQKDPQVLMVHPDHPSSSLADLRGTPVFIADSAVVTFWPWLKARFGYEDKQIRKYTYSLAPWLVNTHTALEGYVSSEPYAARKSGVVPKTYLFADSGYPGYATMVMVRDAYLNQHPNKVAAFVRAAIKGWDHYLYGDPTAGNKLILKDNPEMSLEQIAFSRGELIARQMTGPRDQLGRMCEDRWTRFYQEMVALDILKPGLDASDVFTNRFVGGTRADCRETAPAVSDR